MCYRLPIKFVVAFLAKDTEADHMPDNVTFVCLGGSLCILADGVFAMPSRARDILVLHTLNPLY